MAGRGIGVKPVTAPKQYGKGTSRQTKSQVQMNSQKQKSDGHYCIPGIHHMTRPGSAGGGHKPKYPTHPVISVGKGE